MADTQDTAQNETLQFDDNADNANYNPFVTTDTEDDNTWASWENILDYIKYNLGASVNSIELKDDEIIGILTKHVLPVFSKYIPLHKYLLMFENSDCIQHEPFLLYKLKTDYKILRVEELIYKPGALDLNQFYSIQQNGGDIINYLISTVQMSMATDIVPRNYWNYIAPDKLQIILGANNYWASRDFIVKLSMVHKDPSTVDPDQYTLLKDLALAEIMIAIGRIRTKFANFSTPQAQVELASDQMIQEGQQLKQQIMQELEALPPEQYVWWFND